jgi:MoaA/NifB/PqqE/SkfB family radical SAM enzyme
MRMGQSAAADGGIRRIRERYADVVHMAPRFKPWRAYVNCLRGYYEYKLGVSRLKSRPVKLIFDPTNACHLACPLCPTGLGMIDRPTGRADLELFRRLMEQVGDYVFLIDFYNWGDPLLNPRLEEFIRVANCRNIISTISSNLSVRLSDERIDRLLTSGVNEIIISLDGATEATHTKYRRKSNFNLILDNIRRIAEARRRLGQSRPLLTWQYIVFGFNEHEMDRAREMAAELGVDRITFRPPFLQTDRYRMPDEDRREIASWSPADPRYQVHIANPPERKRCGWHYTTVAINWDGTVTPCSTSFRQEEDFGTFGKTGENAYMDVVNNAAFQAARATIAAGGQSLANRSASGVICERCPTPSIQNYHFFVYRRIAMITCVAAIEAIRRDVLARVGLVRGRAQT